MYFSPSHTIAPQQTLLVANYSATTTDKTLLTNQIISIATSSLSLSNDHLLIELHDAAGALRDTAGTGIKPLAGTSSPTNTSMIRVTSSTGWLWQNATNTFHVDAPDLGSPGICDDCETPSSTETEPESIIEESLPEEATRTQEEPPLLIEELIEESIEESITEATSTIESSSTEEIYVSPPSTTSSVLSEPEEPHSDTTSTAIVVAATSTDQTATLEDATSTPVVAPTSTAVVTTTATTPPVISAPSAPSVSPPTTSVAPNTPSMSAVAPTIPDPLITEVMASPLTNQSEWIELLLPFGASPLRYIDWRIKADGKLVFRFTTTTVQTMTRQDDYLLATWKSARLKNAGALVRLERADGTAVQELRYATSAKGDSWMRDDVSGTWNLTHHPTPAAPNIFEATPTTPPKTSAAPKTPVSNVSTTKPKSTPITEIKNIEKSPSSSASTSNDIRSLEVAATTKKASSAPTSKKTTAPKPKSTTAKALKKTSTKKSLIIPSTVTHFEQIPPEQLSPRVRVRLQGLVGSTVGVFGKQRFVLLAPDGRGLWVKASTQQPSPNLGETIEITGLLFANDEGVQLQMETGDTWKPVVIATTSTPRLVDWNAPGLEDQWSLTRLEGLVTDSRASAITLESQIGEVTIPIKAVLGYRAQRVKAGDTIEVLGIFDGRGGQWKIQPSKASDIVILKHPEPEQTGAATSPSNTKLPWNAIGIAIGSIGAVEGIRRWLEKRKNTLQAKETPATILGA